MASKKKRTGRDDFDSDLDFDIPDFGGSNPEVVAKNRKPISTGLKSAASGFGKTFTSEARLRQTLTKSLPREYEEPISKAFEFKDGVRDLYNNAAKEANETVRETKRSVGRIARNMEAVLPKKLSDRLKRFGDSADSDSSGYGSQSKEEVENGTIDNAFAGIFADMQQQGADQQKKDNARQIMQDAIDRKRHGDMTTILGSIDQSILSMQARQEKVGTNYMKKMLELNFRQYFVQNDMLQLQTKFFQMFKDDLSAITKNTGLPDYVKKAPKEALLEHIREKTFDSLANTLSKKRSQWMQGVFKKAGSKISGAMGQFRDMSGQVLDAAEQVASMQASGMGPSGSEMAGDIAGGWAGGKAQNWAAKKIGAQMAKNKGVVKFGNKLNQATSSAPQWLGKQMAGDGWLGKMPEWAKEILGQDGESSHIRLNKEVDIDRATQFSDRNSRSLNIVIPELLSRIHHELYVQRTGDVKAQPLAYDYEKGKFTTNKEKLQSLSKSIVSDRTVANTKNDSERIFKEIDPEGKIDSKTRAKIAESIYGANKRNTYFDKDAMTSYGVLGDHEGMQHARGLISKYIDKDTTGASERKLSKLFAQMGNANGDVNDIVQHFIDTGRHGELEQLGLIDQKTGQINTEMLRRLELGGGHGHGLKDGVTAPNAPHQKTKGTLETLKKKMGTGGGGSSPKAQPAMGSKADFEEVAKLFRESIQSLNKLSHSGKMDDSSTKVVQEAIEKAGGKTELLEIRDILLRIEQRGMQPGVSLSPEAFAAWMKQQGTGMFGKAGSAVGGAAKRLAGFLGSSAKSSWGASMKTGKAVSGWLFSKGTSGLSWLGKQKDKFDLYVEGELKPRLEKYKLDNGRYMDVSTGKIITKFSDITGDVKDIETGEIVLRLSDIKNAVLKNVETGKSVLARLTDWGSRAVKFAGDSLTKSAKSLFGLSTKATGFAMNTLRKTYEHLTDGPMDVYLKDQYETPVLLKRVMAAGLYFDKSSLDSIKKVSEIKGPVVDNEENVLITKEDLANGLFDKHGKEIKTGFDRVMQFVGGSFKRTLQTYRKILGGARDMGAKAMGWLKGLFGFDSPFTVFSRTTNDILTAIYNLLNNRMPGDRSPELSTLVGKNNTSLDGGGKLASGFKKARETLTGWKNKLTGKAGSLKDKAEAYKDEHWDDAKNEVRDRMGRGKDKVVDGLHAVVNTLRERLPEPKKAVFGDSNGDGVRDGSIDDLRSKRDKLKDRAADAAGKAKDSIKGGGKGILATLASLFKKKKDGEEGDEKDKDGSDINIDNSGKGEKGEKGTKPKGKFGRGWDKFKGKITPKGSGLGARALRLGGSVLGGLGRAGLAIGRFGGAALLGGGLLSAETIMAGLSLVGSALGMAGTAIGAVLSSPITVPALAIAAAGTGAYFAYKWLTKPDPQPIEKVRLVQYGWKSDDLEAYKKMKSLEKQVVGAVSFKGDKAEFDSQKLNIQEMMKVYDLDPKNQDHAKKFVDWFANRFRPVYLNHRALIKIVQSPKELDAIDDAKPDIKQKYLDQCLFPGDHYSVTTSPFKDQSYTFTAQGSVERQIKLAKAEVEKEGTKKDEKGKGDKPLKSVLQMAQEKKAAEAKLAADLEKNADAKAKVAGVPGKDTVGGEKASALNRLAAATTGSQTGPGGPNNPVSGPAGPGGQSSQGNGKFDAGGLNIKQIGNGTGGDINAIPIPKGNGNWAALKDTIVAASKMAGVDPKLAAAITAVESNFDANARPYDKKTGGYFSSAKGLNQFIDGTWRSMMGKYAKKYGIDPATSALDPRANALMGAEFMKENMDGLKSAVKGRTLTATDVYIAHFMGLGGARKFLSADPNASGVALFPEAAKANPWIYYKDPKTMTQPKTLSEIYGDFTKKLSNKLTQAGYTDSDLAAAGADPEKTKADNAKLQTASEGGAMPANTGAPERSGVVNPSATVASPKPTVPNTATAAAENAPNTGPAPSAYTPKASQIVASPRPSYDPNGGGSAASAPTAKTPGMDPYYQKQSSVNTGDSLGIMKDSLKAQVDSLAALTRIGDLLEKQPEKLVSLLSEVLADKATTKTASAGESNNYGKGPSKEMPQPSASFRRSLAGT